MADSDFEKADKEAEVLEAQVISVVPATLSNTEVMQTPKDIMESQQLGERQFWVDVFHPELGKEVRYPGAFVKASESPLRLGPRAPSTGEHNTDIYQGDLGFSAEKIEALKRKGVI